MTFKGLSLKETKRIFLGRWESNFKAGLHFHIHNNKWQCNSFFCTKKKKKKKKLKKEEFFFKKVKKNQLAYVRNLELPPPHPCTQSYALGLTPPLPPCAYVLCGWPHYTIICKIFELIGKSSIDFNKFKPCGILVSRMMNQGATLKSIVHCLCDI